MLSFEDLFTKPRRAAKSFAELLPWFGLVAPAGTPRPVIDRLAGAANRALRSEDVAAKLRKQGFEPLGGPPDEFTKFIGRETEKWAVAAEAAGMRK